MREDFYYRGNTLPNHIPPLRERPEDLPLLIDDFLEKFAGKNSRLSLPRDIIPRLLNHHWPGNIRELQNVLKRYAALEEIHLDRVGPGEKGPEPEIPPGGAPSTPGGSDMARRLDRVEKESIVKALEENRWHVSRTAAALGLSRRTLQRRLKKHGIK